MECFAPSRSIPGFGLDVKPPSREAFSDASLAFLTLNPLYHDAVLARLTAMGVQAKLVFITPTGVELCPNVRDLPGASGNDC